MVRYTQRDLWSPSSPTGSCMRASWGSLMRVNPDEFPRWTKMERSVWSYNYRAWFLLRGYRVKHAFSESPPIDDNAFNLWCASGESPRSTDDHPVTHQVVWGPDGLVWDPHPSREGLDTDQPHFEYLAEVDFSVHQVDNKLYLNGVRNAW